MEVKLRDGGTLVGILSGETPTSITVSRLGAAPATVARSQILSMAGLSRSAMPEGLDAQTTPQGMADLLAYLRSAR